MKIFLSPSNQTANIGCYKEYNLNECLACEKIAKSVMEHLSEYDCEVSIAERMDDMNTRVTKATEWGANVYIPIHTNAYVDSSVWGVETFYHSADAEGKELATNFLDSIGAMIGKKRRAKTYDNLIEINSPKCTRAYIECDFHTNPDRTKWMVDNFEKFGNCISKTLIDFYNINIKESESNINNAVTIVPCYKIITGNSTVLIELDALHGVVVDE